MRLAKVIFVALALLACGTAWSAPGHYLVVEIDAAGHAVPVFYRQIELPERAPPSAVEFEHATMDPEQVAVSGKGWRQVAQVPRFIRGEFAANGVDGEIEAHSVPAAQRSFALRIPGRAGNRLRLEFLGRHSELHLDEIARNADRLVLAGQAMASAPPPANSGNRVDILVLGDGYTSAEQATFNADAETLRTSMFGFTPYKQYASFVNWNAHFVASSQSGADHPPYLAGCTSASCCADIAAQTDPRAGAQVATAFDGRFCTSQIHRLVTVNSSKILAAASAFPETDEILVLLNDPVYGGSGGQFSVTTTNVNARLIVIHEYGHTFHRLADEYSSPYPGFGACSDINGDSPCEPNVSDQLSRTLVKWKDWLTPGIAIPTPGGTAGVGLFEGARYQSIGVYRPQNACMMRSLGPEFCAVCSQEYVLRLYRGGFGNSAPGIDLIEPGSESPSPASTVNYVPGTTQAFSATVLRPSPDTVSLQWYLDGQAIVGANSASYNFQQATTSPALRKLELLAFDATPLVNANVASSPANIDIMSHWRAWNIQVQAPPVTVSIADASTVEGNSGVRELLFTISLSQAAATNVSFNVATADLRSGGYSARAGSDYVANSRIGVSIPAGQTSVNFAVKVLGDFRGEADEAFQVAISNVSGADPGDVGAVGWILDDDDAS